MSVIEGIYHNPDTGTDERRALACDANGRLRIAPSQAVAYPVGSMANNTQTLTTPLDLGDGHPYTILIARKNGAASPKEALQIQTSLDGSLWLPAPGLLFAMEARFVSTAGMASFNVRGRPVGRFVRILYQNGDVAQTDLVLELAALAGA